MLILWRTFSLTIIVESGKLSKAGVARHMHSCLVFNDTFDFDQKCEIKLVLHHSFFHSCVFKCNIRLAVILL